MNVRLLPSYVLALSIAMPILAADAPASAPATSQASVRSVDAIMKDLSAASAELGKSISSARVFTDAAQRGEAAPTAIPLLKRMVALGNELIASGDARGKNTGKMLRDQMLPVLVTFGDKDTEEQLQKDAASTDSAQAVPAKSALLLSRWWKSSSDAAAQEKLLDDATSLAKENPESMDVARTLMTMSQLGAASPDLSDKLQSVLVDNMKGNFVDDMKQRVTSARKMRSIEGKPLAISGKTVDGKDFSSDEWKGKVILVDFWATWCGPCIAELPRVKKTYADFHDKGLEILGVSNDYSASDLTKFVAADPKMPWPHLFDAKAAAEHQWNPITTGFGIHGIPTMFLIDKKGVCRTVKARENFEELIPKMLEE